MSHGGTQRTAALPIQPEAIELSNVPAGTYIISPVAPAFALEDEVTNNSVVVSEGETVEGINFSLVPGGVITGKISDADGKPLIEQYVTVLPIDVLIYRRTICWQPAHRRPRYLPGLWLATREVQSIGGPERIASRRPATGLPTNFLSIRNRYREGNRDRSDAGQ